VSRYFVDARVLSIFEGADETSVSSHCPPLLQDFRPEELVGSETEGRSDGVVARLVVTQAPFGALQNRDLGWRRLEPHFSSICVTPDQGAPKNVTTNMPT